jgi:hypothetical protein
MPVDDLAEGSAVQQREFGQDICDAVIPEPQLALS